MDFSKKHSNICISFIPRSREHLQHDTLSVRVGDSSRVYNGTALKDDDNMLIHTDDACPSSKCTQRHPESCILPRENLGSQHVGLFCRRPSFVIAPEDLSGKQGKMIVIVLFKLFGSQLG
ncbi:hypothetical protein QCA50_003894 [Cerrena zonata]|uniref:Uncharacterized protein n=1 Tax=Cerrena zonata TaxID=2478898 RepID=A0AAW0GMA3_9APHY